MPLHLGIVAYGAFYEYRDRNGCPTARLGICAAFPQIPAPANQDYSCQSHFARSDGH